MASVYVMREDGGTEVMTRVRCESEDRELQLIVEWSEEDQYKKPLPPQTSGRDFPNKMQSVA